MILIAQPVANAIAVPRLLLKALGIKVTDKTLKEKLENHPDFPSLMAVSDCFNEWQISNAAYHIPKEEYKAEELQFPFIAQAPTNGGLFILVHQIINGQVIYSDRNVKKAKMTEALFLEGWSGILLYAEANEKSGEEGYVGKKLLETIDKLKIPAAVLILVLSVVLAVNFSAAPLDFSLLLVIKFIGIGISALLLAHSVDANNPLIQNLCSLGKKNNCNAILKSDAAQATSWLSWSEVGFFYFAGSFLSLLFVPSSISLLILFNICALPYTVWSIYYQYSHKNWCVLCCTVQALLCLELFAATGANSWSSTFSAPTSYVGMLVSFIAPVLLWYILKPTLQKSSEYHLLKQQLKKFKYNSELFGHALTKQPRYAVPNEIAPIILGNPEAETIITMVSNPFCEPCAKAHKTLDNWIKTRNDIQVKLIFTSSDFDNKDRNNMVRHVTALGLTKDLVLIEKALTHWYAQREKKYEDWAKSYQINIGEEVDDASKKQKQWCDIAKITLTPTILINGYKLPEPYSLEDVQYLIN